MDHKILSEPFDVFEFDFQHQYRREFIKIDPQSKFFDVEITEDGVARCVMSICTEHEILIFVFLKCGGVLVGTLFDRRDYALHGTV